MYQTKSSAAGKSSHHRWRSHRQSTGIATVGGLIRYGAWLLHTTDVCCANGMQDPFLEAEYLVCHALSIPFEQAERFYRRPVPRRQHQPLLRLLEQRIRRKVPAAYLTQEAFFAGHRFYVDQRVLIPRSRIENLFDDEAGLTPWIDPDRVETILDVGTGSGCLAITMALAWPQSYVDAVDLSRAALAVAAINRRQFGLTGRLRLIHSDLFDALDGQRYDLMVANPPYVPTATWQSLPKEYQHEPALALRAGEDGLAIIERLLRQAADHLSPHGILICESGDEVEPLIQQRWPELQLEWLPFHFGASGVFVTSYQWLQQWLAQRSAP
ncbi:MAG: 50S ribosomal protein L3 N(5)-glutamine methyltransferase [Magnetococcales bacterium]|nr:50S ribosomal protein L3 N(5)-glutamine methyltransferase [Magnetococcales bacterium]